VSSGSNSKRLTDLAIERLRSPSSGRHEVWDTSEPGLGVRVGLRDKSFALKLRFDGRQQWLTIGGFPAIGIAKAREKARKLKLLAQRGVDPRKHERERELANTVAAVVDEYIERHAKPNQRTWLDTKRRLQRDLVRLHGDRPIKGISRADVNRMLDDARDRGVGVGANRLLAHAKRFFAWCVERGLIETSPAENVRRPVKEASRDQILSDDELVAIWKAAGGLGFPYGPAIRLLMLLGQRRDEVGRMRWRHLDLEAASWTLPAEENKSGRLHVVPLPSLAVDILNETPRVGAFVFWALKPEIAINGWGRVKRRLDAASGVENWRLHDLRRTVASGLARLGFEPFIVERVLNHATTAAGPLAKVYQRYDYDKEKRRALDAWSRHVKGLLDPPSGNVLPLRRADLPLPS
jgi:integrase